MIPLKTLKGGGGGESSYQFWQQEAVFNAPMYTCGSRGERCDDDIIMAWLVNIPGANLMRRIESEG
jgi:hypothetical protein